MFRSDSDPAAPAAEPPDDLVGEAITVFQSHYREPLTRDDGKEIVRNLGDVLLLLAEWKRQDAPPASDPSPPATEPAGPLPVARVRRPKRRKFPAETP